MNGEAVGGIVMMIASGNAKQIVEGVRTRVEEINTKNMLPGGLRVVPAMPRDVLVNQRALRALSACTESHYLTMAGLRAGHRACLRAMRFGKAGRRALVRRSLGEGGSARQ